VLFIAAFSGEDLDRDRDDRYILDLLFETVKRIEQTLSGIALYKTLLILLYHKNAGIFSKVNSCCSIR